MDSNSQNGINNDFFSLGAYDPNRLYQFEAAQSNSIVRAQNNFGRCPTQLGSAQYQVQQLESNHLGNFSRPLQFAHKSAYPAWPAVDMSRASGESSWPAPFDPMGAMSSLTMSAVSESSLVLSSSISRPQRRNTGPALTAVPAHHQLAVPFGATSSSASTPSATSLAASPQLAPAHNDGFASIQPAPAAKPPMGVFKRPQLTKQLPALEPAATIKKSRAREKPKKPKSDEPIDVRALIVKDFEDNGQKPSLSYAQMIATAISDSPRGRLTLSQIYDWIRENFRFYRNEEECGTGWQNSIRHNLSLHRCFEKVERPKGDPGKGHYWVLTSGAAAKKDADIKQPKPTRTRSAPMSATLPVDPNLPSTPPRPSTSQSLPVLPANGRSLDYVSTDAPISGSESDVSADAAIATALGVGSTNTSFNTSFGALNDACFSINTSFGPRNPPNPPSPEVCSSPPPIVRNGHTPACRPRKRAHEAIEDSGYASALESSTMRAGRLSELLDSDRPHKRRSVRAEDEISRMRMAASPLAVRRVLPIIAPVSHRIDDDDDEDDDVPVVQPLTPNVRRPRPSRLAPPPQPQPSISPNTTLRLHRAHVNSLLGPSFPANPEVPPYSPAFNLDHCTRADIDIFQDSPATKKWKFMNFALACTGSPITKPGKSTTPTKQRASALADITGVATNRGISTVWDVPSTPAGYTPSKFLRFESSPPNKGPTPRKSILRALTDNTPTRSRLPITFDTPTRTAAAAAAAAARGAMAAAEVDAATEAVVEVTEADSPTEAVVEVTEAADSEEAAMEAMTKVMTPTRAPLSTASNELSSPESSYDMLAGFAPIDGTTAQSRRQPMPRAYTLQ